MGEDGRGCSGIDPCPAVARGELVQGGHMGTSGQVHLRSWEQVRLRELWSERGVRTTDRGEVVLGAWGHSLARGGQGDPRPTRELHLWVGGRLRTHVLLLLGEQVRGGMSRGEVWVWVVQVGLRRGRSWL